MASRHRHEPPPATELVRRLGALVSVLGVAVSGLVRGSRAAPGAVPRSARAMISSIPVCGDLERLGGAPEELGQPVVVEHRHDPASSPATASASASRSVRVRVLTEHRQRAERGVGRQPAPRLVEA